jgi:hypothetical protein
MNSASSTSLQPPTLFRQSCMNSDITSNNGPTAHFTAIRSAKYSRSRSAASLGECIGMFLLTQGTTNNASSSLPLCALWCLTFSLSMCSKTPGQQNQYENHAIESNSRCEDACVDFFVTELTDTRASSSSPLTLSYILY